MALRCTARRIAGRLLTGSAAFALAGTIDLLAAMPAIIRTLRAPRRRSRLPVS